MKKEERGKNIQWGGGRHVGSGMTLEQLLTRVVVVQRS